MKKAFIAVALLLSTTQLFSQTLFTYGKNAVSKDEFLRAYNKNKMPVTDKEKSLREYLNLYLKFKLKVKAAEELKLDTLPQLKADVANFRSQIVDGYINDDAGLPTLVEEAFERCQKDIHLLHFFIASNDGMTPTDTAKAFTQIQTIYGELKTGKTNFEKIENGSFSDLGFITVFSLPYLYENIAYTLQVGQTSLPFRSKGGWHIFKNVEERRSIGKLKVAQILFAIPENATPLKKITIQRRADSIYTLLQAGHNFGELAKNNSDDKLTYLNEGILPEFGSGKYELSFEKNVLTLSKDSEISKPFLTSHGFHIVKRLSQTPTPTEKNDPYVEALKQRILIDERMVDANKKFCTDAILPSIQFKRNKLVSAADIYRFADSAKAQKSFDKYPFSNKVLFTFSHASVKGLEWLNFIKNYKQKRSETDSIIFDKYIALKATDYYRNHLEEYNPTFKYQMREFKEGNVLFTIMEKKVWNNAASDSNALKNYYTTHKQKYLWQKSADLLTFTCTNDSLAKIVLSNLNKNDDWQKIATDNKGKIQADSGRFEINQLPISIKDNQLFTGSIVSTTTPDGTVGIIKILKAYPINQERSFTEAKGLVINDYQNYLEQKWIEQLKQKYPAKVNEAVFQSLLK